MSTKNRFFITAYILLLSILYVKSHIPVEAQGILPQTYVACKSSAANCSFVGDTSIQQALDAARSGDVVEIRAGTYNTTLTLSPKSVFIQGAGRRDTIINGSITINGLNNSIIKIEKLTVQNGSGVGIQVNGSPTLSLNEIILRNHAGDGLEGTDNAIIVLKSSLVDRNEVGIRLSTKNTVSVINSIVSNNRSHGIHRSSESILLYQTAHTILYNNGGDGIRIDNLQLDLETANIENNIFMNNKGYGIMAPADLNDLFYTHNLFFNNTSDCSNQRILCNTDGTILDTDPLFVNPQNGDFRPQEGSPIIDSGNGLDPDSSVADLGIYGGIFACDSEGAPLYCETGVSATVAPSPNPSPESEENSEATQRPQNSQENPRPVGQISADANGDNAITVADFEVWRSEFRNPGSGTRADFNGDGKVNAQDFEAWRSAFKNK